jgi:hypothetical protein
LIPVLARPHHSLSSPSMSPVVPVSLLVSLDSAPVDEVSELVASVPALDPEPDPVLDPSSSPVLLDTTSVVVPCAAPELLSSDDIADSFRAHASARSGMTVIVRNKWADGCIPG